MNEEFSPNYLHILEVLHNRRPERLPLYEHNIDEPFIAKVPGYEVLGPGFGIRGEGTNRNDLEEYYRIVTRFWKEMTFDAFSYEAAICEIYPGHGAILGGMLGPIQTRADFERYPWKEVPEIFWRTYTPHLEAIRKVMPDGMKAYGGCGYGIFESSEDLVGFESLAVMQYLDPELFADLFVRIGDLYVELWSEMMRRYGDLFVFCRMGDDLGFRSATLLEPDTIGKHVLPQYKRVIDIVHGAGKKFLLHSCGCIFDVMEDIIALGIDAKHSNEDAIAPFERWIDLYGDRIGLFGGIDVNILCLNPYEEVKREVVEKGLKYRSMAKGFGLGSGNSIAGYVPVEGFMGMVDAAKEIRSL